MQEIRVGKFKVVINDHGWDDISISLMRGEIEEVLVVVDDYYAEGREGFDGTQVEASIYVSEIEGAGVNPEQAEIIHVAKRAE